MSLRRSQIEQWNPATLTSLADAWTRTGASVESLFARYVDAVTLVGGAYWEGPAADAAQARAHSDLRTAIGMADGLDELATAARRGFHDLDGALRVARTLIAAAEADGFIVHDSLGIGEGRIGESQSPERVEAMNSYAERIPAAAAAAADIDRAISQELDSRRENLAARFTSAASLGDVQARTDADAMLSDPASLSTEQRQRLIEAGELSDEQVSALASGNTASIPASQMEYLEQLARSLDWRSPAEIARLIDTLPEGAGTGIANGLQILSNESVTTAVDGDDAVPRQGGLDRLPDGIRASLTRDDLVDQGHEVIGNRPYYSVALNGVADNNAIAAIAGSADDRYQTGTALDRALLDVGDRYLAAQVAHEQSTNSTFEVFTVDGIGSAADASVTEDIFAAVAPDKQVIADAFTSDRGPELVQNLFTHQWSDDGAAVSDLVRFEREDMRVNDIHDPVDVAGAETAGRIMSGVGEALSTDESWQLVSNVPNADGQSIGQINPELVRETANGMSNYMSQLVDGRLDSAERPGFTATEWNDPAHNQSYPGARNLFAALSTDETAGQTMMEGGVAATAAHYGALGRDFDTATGMGNWDHIGYLMAVQDAGTQMALMDQYNDQATATEMGYNRGVSAYDAVRSIALGGLAELPGGSLAGGIIAAGGDDFRDALFGVPDSPGAPPSVPGPSFPNSYYTAVQQLALADQIPPEVRAEHSHLFRPDGTVRPWDEISVGSQKDYTDEYRTLLSRMNADPGRLLDAYSIAGRK